MGGDFDSGFCKSKDFKAFLRCSCVHFFPFVFAIITIICFCFFFIFSLAKKKKVSQKGSMLFGVVEIRKAFICKEIRTNFDYAEPLDGLVAS